MTDRGRALGLLPRCTSLRGTIAGGCSRVGEEGAECVSCESSLPRGRLEGGLREGEALVTGGWLGCLQTEERQDYIHVQYMYVYMHNVVLIYLSMQTCIYIVQCHVDYVFATHTPPRTHTPTHTHPHPPTHTPTHAHTPPHPPTPPHRLQQQQVKHHKVCTRTCTVGLTCVQGVGEE